jgi:Zn-dependent peptidase ImmA (M78 family)
MFGHVDGTYYLCHMKYLLKTKTTDLSSHQIRKVVGEAIKWCEDNVGVKVSRQRTFKYRVLTLPDGYTPAYGCYDYDKNTLYIFRNHADNIKMVVRTVLHEYTHFLQNLRSYHTLLKKVGYDNHPHEVEARSMEVFYSVCWKDIKNNL